MKYDSTAEQGASAHEQTSRQQQKMNSTEGKKERGEDMPSIHCVLRMGQVLFARVATCDDSRMQAKEIDRIHCRKLRCGIMSADLIDYGTMVSTKHTLRIRTPYALRCAANSFV